MRFIYLVSAFMLGASAQVFKGDLRIDGDVQAKKVFCEAIMTDGGLVSIDKETGLSIQSPNGKRSVLFTVHNDLGLVIIEDGKVKRF